MSGVLHPVGPEPARTYWVRRGILAAVVLLLALGVVLAVGSLTRAAVATAPPPAIAPAPADSTPSVTSAPTPSATSPTTSSPTTTSKSPASSTSASPSTSVGAQSTASAVPSNPNARASSAPSAKPTPKPTPAGTPDCSSKDLRVTLKGDRTLSPGENNTFRLSVINGGAQTCLASVTDQSFELKIYSGKDRIWSSRDCTKVLADFDAKLASQADKAWTMKWNGERSVAGKKCRTGSDTPLPGTYWATAQLKGADPVQLRMIIS